MLHFDPCTTYYRLVSACIPVARSSQTTRLALSITQNYFAGPTLAPRAHCPRPYREARPLIATDKTLRRPLGLGGILFGLPSNTLYDSGAFSTASLACTFWPCTLSRRSVFHYASHSLKLDLHLSTVCCFWASIFCLQYLFPPPNRIASITLRTEFSSLDTSSSL